MGHKDKLKGGLEFDVLYGRKIYCYLKNNSKLKRYAKNRINRRNRYIARNKIKETYIADVHDVNTQVESHLGVQNVS